MTKQSFKYKQQICFDCVHGPFYSLSANINTNGFGLQDCPWGEKQSQEHRGADFVYQLNYLHWKILHGSLENLTATSSERKSRARKSECWSRKMSTQYLNKKIMAVHWTGSSHIPASHSVNAQEWHIKMGYPTLWPVFLIQRLLKEKVPLT